MASYSTASRSISRWSLPSSPHSKGLFSDCLLLILDQIHHLPGEMGCALVGELFGRIRSWLIHCILCMGNTRLHSLRSLFYCPQRNVPYGRSPRRHPFHWSLRLEL